MKTFYCVPEVACWVNDSDALIPEVWALEALRTLGSNMVMGALVSKDFSANVQSYGDVVNTSRPSDFSGKRKTDVDNITVQDAVSSNIRVPLDQHVHVSFKIKDGELSKALPDLVQRYLEPAAREMAEKVDQILCGQVARLLLDGASYVGGLQLMTKANASDYVLAANTELDVKRAPKANRNLVLGPRAQQAALGADLFVSAEKRGDLGTALRSASLGSVYGLDSFMDQNVTNVVLANQEHEVAAPDGSYAAGVTSVATTITTANAIAGDYVTIGGQAYRLATVTDNSGDADVVLDRVLSNAITVADPIVHYPSGQTSVGAAGWAKELTIDQYAAGKHPQQGQILTFGTGVNSHSYTVIAVNVVTTTSSTVLLDRPLDLGVADNAACYFYPAGGVNLAFVREAIALVSRPLVQIPSATGANSFVANYDGLSMRVTMQYDATAQGMIVTFDLLCGVAILDERLACILWS